MKKVFTVLCALMAFTLSSHAELKLHETFNRNVGTLNVGQSGASTNDWYSFSGTETDTYIQVVEGSLSYAGYVTTGTGNKAELVGNGADDLRQFSEVTSGKVYLAAIINVDSLKKSTSPDYFLALGDASNSNMSPRLYIKSIQNSDKKSYVGFQLGVKKVNEGLTNWSSETYLEKTNYLVVLEYEFVAKDSNDVVRVFVNPTVDTTTPTFVCDQSSAKDKPDIKKIASVNLRKGTNTPGRVFVDEIKVATEWADLFEISEGGGDDPKPAEPVIVANDVIKFEDPVFYCTFTGETYTKTLTVKAENLTEDITLTCTSPELTLSATTIAKDDADLADGKEIIVTLTPTTASPEKGSSDTIKLTSGGLTETVTVNWAAWALTHCADVATMKAKGAEGEGWDVLVKFTGEAVVTFIESKMSEGTTFFTIEDATGAVNIDAPYWVGVTLGDKVTNILTLNGEKSLGIQPFLATDSKVKVVSRDNKVTPQEVTLAELKANAADYLLELVVVKGVELNRTVENFVQGSCEITQGEATANINLLAGNPLIGTTKPEAANVTGISSSSSGTVIRPRNAEDIETVDIGAGMEAVEAEEHMEVYTIMGQRVSGLQPGVNIIRKGNSTYKVVR